jgi:hypothetical protein
MVGGGGMRGAQASVGPGPRATGGNFAGRGSQQFSQGFDGRSGGQFAARGFDGGRDFRGHHGFRRHGFGPAFGFAVGLGGGYYDPYYYDDYAYDDYYDGGSPAYVVSSGADPAYCAQRYRSYDPASGTYLGYDGLRHPCP